MYRKRIGEGIINKENQKKIGVLFICLGNICRSPAAEGIFRSKVLTRGYGDKFHIESAGTSGYHDGDPPDQRMQKVGHERGYQFNTLSRRLQVEDLHTFHYLITMDDDNYRKIKALVHTHGVSQQVNLIPMKQFIYSKTVPHIPDPYFGGMAGFKEVIDLLEEGCENFLDFLMDDTPIEG